MELGNVRWSRILVVAMAFAFAGCSGTMGDDETSSDNDYELVEPGKADNFYSNVSREYEMVGTVPVEMTDEEFEDEATRTKKISRRTTAVGLYLTAYLTAKIDDLFDNMDYGGFKSMVRNYSVEREDISEAGQNTYHVEFTIDVAGPPDLAERLLQNGAERAGGGAKIELQMPDGATADPERPDRGVPRDFDPESYSGDLETVEMTAAPLPELKDSYPHYRAFAGDGVYDITVVFGHDYNEDRWDIKTAEQVFQKLERNGFEMPVRSFDQLGADSGPFTKTVRAPGAGSNEQLRIEVRLIHADMYESSRGQHKEDVIGELRERDVFYYWGHAGPYFGFSLGPNSRADIDYREIKDLELSDKKQLVIASGCQTYSQYADMLYANPAKSEANLDVITTVNYSNLAAGDALLGSLTAVTEGYHRPVSFYDLVETVNEPYATRRMDTFYGVIGLDGNPQVHPYGDTEAIGQSCQTNTDCGSHPDANLCVEGACTVRALAEGACPTGTSFSMLGRGSRVEGGVCHR